MHTICKVDGTLQGIEDGGGETVSKDVVLPVTAHLKYELRPSPVQPLIVDLYGAHIWGFGGAIYRLALKNGIVLTGKVRSYGSLTSDELQRARMFDVREGIIGLFPDRASKCKPEIDTFVFGIVSSEPLAEMACTTPGWASSGRPFLFIEGPLPEERTGRGIRWTSGATLRIRHRGFEVWFWPTSAYWKNLVDRETLHHKKIVAIRKESGDVISWDEFNDLKEVVEAFVGWVNHCVSPVFHLKAYMRGSLVYRGYSLHPHPTVQRESFSWLPKYGPGETAARHGDMVNHAFSVFSDTWESNRTSRGVFHIALQMLRSKEKGSPGSRPSLLYLRDAFGAIGILTAMLSGPNRSRSRHQTMAQCLRNLSVPDRIPDKDGRDYVIKNFPELWVAGKTEAIQVKEQRKGTLSRPLANVQNWLVHPEEPRNAAHLLALGGPRQNYFVQVAIWLADLMLMRVVGYEGTYMNRLTGDTEVVPWVAGCRWAD